MPEGKQALLERYRSLRQGMIAAIGGLTDAQMSEPSIDGWSVKDQSPAHRAVGRPPGHRGRANLRRFQLGVEDERLRG